MNDLASLAALCHGIEIRVRQPLTESGQRLIDALGVKVVIDPLAPPAPNWRQMARDVGWHPKHYTPMITPSDPLEIEASYWLEDNRAPEHVRATVRATLARSYVRRGGRAEVVQ